MAVVPGSLKASAQRKGGRVDLEKLLEHTEIHPQGRVQIDPATGKLRSPKNNVLFTKKIKVKLEGQVVAEKEVRVNGGHVKNEGSVWRIPLNGPARYHWKVMQDDHRFTISGRMDRSAPRLEHEEMEEYQYFRVFLKETETIVKEFEWDEVDKKFYKWLAKQDKSKIQLIPLTAVAIPVPQPVK